MATKGHADNLALVVVDVQVGVMKEAWESARIVGNISTAVDKAREKGIPIFWVQHHEDNLSQGSDEWQLVPELQPQEGDVLIHKAYNSAFEETALEAELELREVGTVVLVGAATNWCIRATAYGALDRGYDLTVLEDAHSTGDLNNGRGVIIPAADIIAELNVTLNWSTYPNRISQVCCVNEFEFESSL